VAPSASEKQIAIVISEERLADFITRLLGQSQKISKEFPVIFHLDHEWFRNLHVLLMQRISRQNNYKLLQFSASIFFQDGLVRTLNSSEAFMAFVEIQPLLSIGCQMTWTFLVSFADKQVPEKQQIQITVMSTQKSDDDEILLLFGPRIGDNSGRFKLEIDHTERTWGDDIIALLLAHINSHVQHMSHIRRWMLNNAIKVCYLLSFSSLLTGVWLRIRITHWESRHFLAEKIGAPDLTTISEKLDFLIRRPESYGVLITLMCFLICVIGIFVLPKIIRAVPASFVIFNDITREHMAKQEKKNTWRRNIGDTLLIGIIASLMATWLWQAFSDI
jgi:hypothetical protein